MNNMIVSTRSTAVKFSTSFKHVSTPAAYSPEHNPFLTVMVDVTHRCNMNCRNCYIPNRDIPDMDAQWLSETIARFPRRTHIRIAGAEPTVRTDLPDLIRRVRSAGHLPILMTNGLKLGSRQYVRRLKAAGLRSVYLSFNGGFDDDLYEAIDDLRCARRKIAALNALCDENMYVALGMILVRGLNEDELFDVYRDVKIRRQVYEFHIRGVAPYGRYMATDSYRLEEMVDLFSGRTDVPRDYLYLHRVRPSCVDVRVGRIKLQFTEWPDLDHPDRGRLAPDGTVQPAFEHAIANEGEY